MSLHRSSRRTPPLGALVATLVLFATACAGPREAARPIVPQGQTTATTPTYFYQRAFEELTSRYIQPVDPASLAVAGLSNLGRIDARVVVRSAEARLELIDGETIAGTFELPRRDDVQRWAALSAQTIEAARGFSSVLRDTPNDRVFRTFMDGSLSKLDTYTRYDDPDRARESRAVRDGFGGIGITVGFENGETRVDTVSPDTPAARAGLRVGDRIVAVDGRKLLGLSERDVIVQLRGPVGTELRLDVRRPPSDRTTEMRLLRGHIVPATVTYRRDGDLAYIKVSGFNQRTTETLADAVRRAKADVRPALRGIVLDLRGNLGGLLDQAVGVSDLFLAQGTIVSTRGRHRASHQSMTAQPGDVGEDVPLVVLVNGQSASASEIVAAALQDNGRAIVVGSTSFGKGSVQTLVQMPNDGELVITWARFHAPSGYPLADLGVIPAYCTSGRGDNVADALAAVRSGRLTDAATMIRWRAADHANMAGLKSLREICPPENAVRDGEVALASALLRDPAVFARTLQSVQQAAAVR
jgi:carboxyl-terminal processing protease